MGAARGCLLVPLLLLLALAVSAGQGETCVPPPEPPSPMDPGLSPVELLDLGAAAVRYLRAFTAQCWLPDMNAPIAMFDNSWAVALVTIWNDLTVPSNGLGRLVTAMQLQAEASLMIEDQRPGDALSVLELAVLFTLYPVHHEPEALAAWHRSLASNHTIFVSRRLSLAHTLALMSSAQAAVGTSSRSVDALEAAMIAGRAASELFAITDATLASPPPPAMPQGSSRRRGPAGTAEGVERTLADVVHQTARVLQSAEPAELERLIDKRGLKCRWDCGRRSALLKILVPALRVPLQLVEGRSEEEVGGVEAPPDLEQQLQPSCRTTPPNGDVVGRLASILAGVVATLQQPLLADIGIRCTNGAGQQQLHRCRDLASAQFDGWAGGEAVASDRMAQMLMHVMQVEEVLWRLDQVLERAMTGVRLGDGTTWVKNRGYTWVLGAHTAAKLYPQGQGAPVYYQTRRPGEPHVGSTICLDKTYLLDTVLRLDQEGLRGLQYALDNLHYAQFHAGGQEAFWRLLAKDNPLCGGPACQTGEDPLSLLVAADAGALLPPAPRPVMLDFRFVSEQQLQANLAAATDPSHRTHDPFVAAFVSLCLVSCASLYLYSNRSRLVRALTPSRSRGAAPGASALLQRSAATAALREALAGENQLRQNAARLAAAIDAAEASGVEKPLVKKARSALQALKRRKQQGGAGTAGAAAAAPHRPPHPVQQQPALQSLGSGLSASSCVTSSSGGSSLSTGTAVLLAAAIEAEGVHAGWPPARSEAGSLGRLGDGEEEEGGSSGRSSTARSPARSPSRLSRAGSGAPPLDGPAPSAAPHLSLTPQLTSPSIPALPEMPASPGTPVESVLRSSSPGSQAGLSSDACTPLPSPSRGRGGALMEAPPAEAAPAAQPPLIAAAEPAAAGLGASPLGDAVVLVASWAGEPAATPPKPPAASPPNALHAAADGAAASPRQQPRQLVRQLTPRQQKKLLRLQQKHGGGGGAPHSPPSLTASEDYEPLHSPGAQPPSPPSAAASPAKPPGLGRPGGGPGEQCAGGGEASRQLTKKELQALAAREESFPSKQPKKKKPGKAAAPSSTDSSLHGGMRAGGGRDARRADPLTGDGVPGSLRRAGSGAARGGEAGPPPDARMRHMSRWPAPQPHAPSETTLNAHAPEFSPSPSRQHAPSPEAPACGPPSLLHSPFVADGGGGGRLPHGVHGLPFSPDSSLAFAGTSGHSSLDPQQSQVAAAALAAAASRPSPPPLLAQLQHIWGGGGGAAAAPLPGYGAGLAGVSLPPGGEASAQQQLAALLFMQQLELQQRLGGGPGLLPEPPSAPLSPRQLPAVSADLLREVLGSPLAMRHGGSPRDGAWAGLGGGADAALLSPASSHGLHSSLSLTSELAQAQLQALRQMGELPEPAAQRRCSSAGAGLDDRLLGGGPLPPLRRLADGGSPLSSPDRLAPAGPVQPPSPAALAAHRIDSFDLEALGFTESGG